MSWAKFEQYEAYKDSELEWLGEVPAHWRLDRVKHLTNTQSGTTPHSETSSFYEDGTNYWIRTTDLNNGRLWGAEYKVTDLAVESCGLKSIPVNSVLLAMYGGMGTIGKNAILQVKATINQSVCAVLPNEKRFNSVYFWYYLQYFRPQWEMFANSARKDPNINQEEIKRLWFINPPLLEQTAIAAYLDTKTAQIDRKIDLLSQKATQYGKLKQALINETVTRGLDKTVPLKDSGVEWIGEVPAHWEIKRLKDIGSSIIGVTYSPEDVLDNESSGILVLRSSNIQNGQLSLLDNVYVSKAINPRQILRKGDILICSRNGSRALIGKNIRIDERTEGQTFGAFMTVYRSRYFRFISKFFNSNVFESQSGLFGSSTVNQLTINTLNNFVVILPPPQEQTTIAAYLDEKTAHIDRIIATIHTQIDKLKELRKTLINDVVTGKIKASDKSDA